MSFIAARPSPSQRRLREIAHDVEQLGHIAEHKAYSRKSMKYAPNSALAMRLLTRHSPEQIQALRSEAGYEEAPELPPPASADEGPSKLDTPPRESRARNFTSGLDSSPLVVSSPNLDNLRIGPASPTSGMTPMIRESRVHVDSTPDTPIAPPTKTASKRKFNRDEYEPMALEKVTDENAPPRALAKKVSMLNKAHGKTLKELASMRREAARAKAEAKNRPALAAKSTNDDVQSPKKRKTAPADDISSLKMRNKNSQPKSKGPISIKIDHVLAQKSEPIITTIEPSSLDVATATPSPSPAIVSSCSPEPSRLEEEHQRDTPPPADIGYMGEASRPSRRNRAAISYAEPNLRDKMRRPRDEKFDAVSGEGKSRRFSQSEISSLDIKRESGGSDSWKRLPAAHPRVSELSTGSAPVSPLSSHSSPQELPMTVQATRRKRTSHAQATVDESDVYEFTSSSPHIDDNSAPVIAKRTSGRKVTASRRFSAAMDAEEDDGGRERVGTRRRSMMV